MTLRRVQVSDFRCLHSTQAIDLDSRYTLISGPNASGKTSLLESIYVLGRGRSFRTRRLDNLIRSGTARFVVYGEVELAERRVGLGIEGSTQGMRGQVGGNSVGSLADLAAVLPVQIIDPEVHRLIEEGPSRRRRFVDWGVFHVEHDFVDRWRKFQLVLKQRNAALKSRQPRPVVAAWDADLVRLARDIHGARMRYIHRLAASAGPIVSRLLGAELVLTYRQGWPKDMDFEDALKRSWEQDLDTGNTQVGPHRAELGLRIDGEPVRDRVSRGQQKLLAAGLLIAQLSLFSADEPVRPTLLLDDPSAELDAERLMRLISEVVEQSVQLVVTSLSGEFSALGSPSRRYAVDRGVLTPL